MTKRTATPAAASAAAPAPQPTVQTPARDEYTGIGGTYVRDAVTGKRARYQPPEAPATPGPADFPTLNPES